MDLKQAAAEIPAVFMALKDRDTPWPAKRMAGITAAYALSPIDLVPDFIPVLGYLDDMLLLPLLIGCCIRMIPQEVLVRSRQRAAQCLDKGLGKKRYFALPILLLWGAGLALLVWLLR